MTKINKIFIGLIMMTVVVGGWPTAAWGQTNQNDQVMPRFAHETEDQLIIMGCEKIDPTNKQALAAALAFGWRPVIPVDDKGQALIVCSAETVQSLRPLGEGEVKGVLDWWNPVYWFKKGASAIKSTANEAARGAILIPINALKDGFQKLAILFSRTLPGLITISGFKTNGAVVKAWPVILTMANLGFLLALLVIALMVTLRLGGGGGIKRLLPRLLLGALLINFSLIIAVAVIDLSRLISALIAVMFNKFEVGEGLAAVLSFDGSLNHLSGALGALAKAEENPWSLVGIAFIEMVVSGLVMVSLFVVMITLAIRYFVLIFLLMVSPLAYLFIAFPNLAKLSKAWWTNFLKYVLYAPAVLLVLLSTHYIIDGFRATKSFDLTDLIENAVAQMITLVFFVVGLMVAAVLGRYTGIVGSAAVLNMVSRGGKRLRNAAYQVGGKGLGVATKPVRDFAKAGYNAAHTRITGTKPGGPSVATRAGEAMFGKPRTRRERRAEKAAVAAVKDTTRSTSRLHSALSAPALAKANVGERLASSSEGRAAINDIAEHSDNRTGGEVGRLDALVRSKAMIKKMSDQQRLEFLVALDANVAVNPTDKKKLINELQNTISKVESGEQSKNNA